MLDEPSFVKVVAELFASGIGRQPMLDELQDMGYDVRDKDTISRWRKDPRVKILVQRINEDRAIQISRRIDSVIEGRLTRADQIPTETLLKIRKEYGGSTLGRQEIANDAVTAGALQAMEENPTFAADLEKLVRGEVDLSEPAPV